MKRKITIYNHLNDPYELMLQRGLQDLMSALGGSLKKEPNSEH